MSYAGAAMVVESPESVMREESSEKSRMRSLNYYTGAGKLGGVTEERALALLPSEREPLKSSSMHVCRDSFAIDGMTRLVMRGTYTRHHF